MASIDDDDDDDDYEEALEASAVKIQRLYRRRAENAAWKMLLSKLPELRKAFIDEEARAAGAEQNVLYSDLALAARESLRSNPLVRRALNRAWRAIVPRGQHVISRALHASMSRKLYLALIIHDAEDVREPSVTYQVQLTEP